MNPGDIVSKGITFVTWYTAHEYYLWIYLAQWVVFGWLIYLILRLDPPYLIVVSFLPTLATYYSVKRILTGFCSSSIRESSREFVSDPGLDSKTSLKLVDMTDREILKTLRENKSIKGDYLNLIREISTWFMTGDLLSRIGKLHALGYLKASRNRITLSAEGLDLLELPQLMFLSNVPPGIARKAVDMRFALIEGNFNGVVDAANKIFESILREAFEKKFLGNYQSEWDGLQSRGVVRNDYENANLGQLSAAAKGTGVLKEGSLHDNLLKAFSRIRVPQKHEKGEPQLEEADACSAMDIVNVFVRYWYR